MSRYKRSTTQGTSEMMSAAIQSVTQKGLIIREAAERHGVPKSSLGERVKALRSNNNIISLAPKLGRYTTVFTREEELEIVEHLKQLGAALMPNADAIKTFYDRIIELLEAHQFDTHQIFNADETGISTAHTNSKVCIIAPEYGIHYIHLN